ncbi:MAG: hypothetical protein MJ239_06370 [Bacilli bacterium]|nr:hypothetical protein [Bacilli bacterium]
MSNSEKEEKKIAKALEVSKHRGAKNFGWWCLGFGSSLIVALGAAFTFGALLPIKTLLRDNDNKYVDEAVGNETLVSFLLNYKDYSISSLPIVKEALKKLVETTELGKYVSIDYEKLDEMSLNGFDFKYALSNCLEIIATLRSVGAMESLGAFSALKTLTTNTPVEGEVDVSSPDFDPNLYYYMNESGRLLKAFDKSGIRVPESVGKELYYPALADVPLLEIMNVFPARISMEGVTDLLSVFTSFEDSSIVYKLFDGYSIKDLGSFNPDKIALSNVVAYGPDTKMLFDVICAAVVGGESLTYETVTIGDLQHLDINQIHIVDILEVTPENQPLLDTLKAATGKERIEDITISDLYDAKMSDAPLTTLISYQGNETLYRVLCQASGKSNYEDLTIGDMNRFDLDRVYLSAVSPEIPDELKTILISACGVSSFDEIMISDLSDFQISKIPLSSVIKNTSENKTLIDILMQATGASSYEALTIASISSFSIDNVLLSTVMPNNESLFNILAQATGKSKEELTVSSLSSFNVDSIKLSTVISSSGGNPILAKLLNDDTVTVGNIGDKLNSLTLFNVYGEDCFTLDPTLSFTPGDHYEKVGDDFVYDNDGNYEGDYYVSKASGMMLFYAWSSSNVDSNTGRPGRYSPTSISFNEFQSIDMSAITESTIYELVASGILVDSGYSNTLKKHTLQEVIDAAALVLG